MESWWTVPRQRFGGLGISKLGVCLFQGLCKGYVGYWRIMLYAAGYLHGLGVGA